MGGEKRAFELLHPVPKNKQTSGKEVPVNGDLRERAYAHLKRSGHRPSLEKLKMSPEELVEELLVYQTELEMQNEELRRAHHEEDLSKQRYRGLFELAPTGILRLDAHGMLLEMNQAAQDILGLKENKIRRPLLLFIKEEMRREFQKHLHRVFAGGGEVAQCTLQLKGHDGAEREVELHSQTLSDGGQGGSCLTTLTDVTRLSRITNELRESNASLERRVAERTSQIEGQMRAIETTTSELRKSEVRFRSTFDQAAVGIAHFSPIGNWILVNDKFCDILGYNREELFKLSFSDLTHKDDFDKDYEDLVRLLKDQIKTFTVEKRFYRRDGQLIWVTMTVSLVRCENGQPDYFITVIKDITDRKLAENELRQRERELRQILDSVNALIFYLDRKGCIVRCNQAARQALGRPQGEIMGYRLDEVLPGTCEAFAQEDVLQVMRTGEAITGIEGRIERRPGEVQWVTVDKTPYYNQGGETVGVIVFAHDITDRKNSEQEIREREERFRSMIENAEDFISILDPDLRFRYVSPSVVRVFGYEEEELVGRQVLEQVHPEDRELVKSKIALALDPEVGQVRLEARHPRKDGSYLYLESIALNMIDNEYVRGFVVNSRDITQRKIAEATLKESQQRLELALWGAGFGSWDWNVQTGEIFYNLRWAEIMEISAEDIPFSFSSWERVIHPDDLADFKTKLRTHETGRTSSIEAEFRVETRSRKYKWLQVRAKVVERDSAGKALRVTGLVQDITKARKDQEKLRVLSLAVEHGPNSILITDLKGDILYVNSKFTEITGYRPEEVLGKNPRILNAGTQSSDVYRRLWESILEGRDWVGELHHRKKSGEFYWEFVSIAPIFNEQGAITNFVSVGRDITERKAMEMSLTRAKETAEEANRIKTEFLVNISHEIRTPLNGILGMSELLGETDMDEQQRKFISSINFSGNALLMLINDLLDLSKIEAGKMSFARERFDLVRTAEEVVQILSTKVAAKEVDLIVRIEPETPREAISDPLKVRQLLLNLVGNAIKFTDEGHIVVTLGFRGKEGEEGLFYLEVKDTGIGIEEQYQERLFEKFTQVDPSLTRAREGTGLGLSICREYVKQMGGELAVKSKPGEGSTFYFTAKLPYIEGSTLPPDLPEGASQLRILLANTNQVEAEVLKEKLHAMGLSLDHTGELEEACRWLRRAYDAGRAYDLAIFGTRAMRGYGEACRELLAGEGLRERTRFVLIDHMMASRNSEASRLLPFAGVMTRPLTEEQFLEQFRAILQGEEPPPAARLRASETGAGEGAGARSGAKVLLAEDNAINRETAEAMLHKLGCEVTLASHGKEAVDKFFDGRFDLVLMDVQMPEIDGFNATRMIRAHEKGAEQTPVVAMTANAMVGYDKICRQAGMDDYIPKPVSIKALRELLERYLPAGRDGVNGEGEGMRGGGRTASTAPPPTEPPDRVFDPESVLGFASNDPELVGSLVDTLKESLWRDWESLKEVAGGDDLEAIGKNAHRLNGTALNIGAQPLHRVCRELEAAAKDGREEAVRALWPRVKAAAESLVHAVENYNWERMARHGPA